MRTLIAINHMSLDGVMQGPGGAGEDPRDGFGLGGWIVPYWNEELEERLEADVAGEFDLLLGRRTFEMLAAHWPHAEPNPITDAFNRATKYVATRGELPMEWVNSQVLAGDAVEAVRRLKAGEGPQIQIYGSSSFLQALIAADLIDEYLIRTYPLVLGQGRRLFEAGAPPRALTLVESIHAKTGVLTSRYRPDGEVKSGDFGQAPSKEEQARREGLAAEEDL